MGWRRLLPFGFCVSRFSLARGAVRSLVKRAGKEKSIELGETKRALVAGRRIMVVVDASREAKAALQWALSQSVQNQDTILLLNVVKPVLGSNSSKNRDGTAEDRNPRSRELLHSLKRFCQARKPEVEVELCLVEAKERGPTIVAEAKRQEVSLLVLGHKKRRVTWRLLMMWALCRSSSGGGVVEYCIQNANCMTLGVRRKGKRGGGYLITSRLHKDFWLLCLANLNYEIHVQCICSSFLKVSLFICIKQA